LTCHKWSVRLRHSFNGISSVASLAPFLKETHRD
jgi:hypothetical protein